MRALSVLLLVGIVLAQDMGMGGGVEFERDILPLLEERCMKCHTVEWNGKKRKPKAGLRFDGKDFILRSRAVVPGKSGQSAMYARITLPDSHEDVMPPDGEVFDAEQLRTIKTWIDAGADFGAWTGRAGPDLEMPDPEKLKRDDTPTGPGRYAVYEELGKGLPAVPGVVLEKARATGARVEPVYPGAKLLRVDFIAAPDRGTDKAIKALAPLRHHIAILGLAESKVSDQSLAAIGKYTHLIRLDLQKTAVTDKGMAALAKAKPRHLRRLNIYGTAITDTGLDPLGTLRTLEQLYVWQTKTSDMAVNELRRLLKGCKIVHKRDLPAAESARREGNRRRR